jgi:hypothetical protein
MKKIIFVLSFCIFSVSAFAQQHLKFKNLPIDGSLESFTEKLVVAGFTADSKRSNYQFLKGKFAGIDGCKIFAYTSPDKVYEVEVDFPSYTLNNVLYDRLKSMYTYKYGKGMEENYYDVNTRTQRVRTIWNLPTGEILLYYGGADVLVVKYTDTINAKLHYAGLDAYKDL